MVKWFDQITIDRHVANEGGVVEAIHDPTIADHHIVCHRPSSGGSTAVLYHLPGQVSPGGQRGADEIASKRVQAMIGGLFDSLAAGDITVLVDRTYPLAEAAGRTPTSSHARR